MNTALKKIIVFFTIFIYGIALIPSALAANAASVPGEKRMFLVTAYYSPLPDQSYYIRGNYQADIRLNGRGTNGADGTEVFTGMLAAPKTYPFGTRIRIPGLGVGEVHDRGGAIIARKNYDRIDVWMGRGEEGLARALNWGARLVEGEVFWKSHQVEPGLSFGWVSDRFSEKWLSKMKKITLQNPKVFNKPITRKSNQANIKELQEALTTFGYYHGPISGIYGPQTTESVLAFQLAEGVILSAKSAGAGNFGPKTRATLKKKLEGFNMEVVKERKRLEENRLLLASGLGKKAEGDDVIALQRMMWELGYYDGKLTGDYDSQTIDAVFEFQKSNGILKSEWERGAGYYGKKTHAALQAAVDQKLDRIAKYPMQMQVWVPAKRELPQIASLQVPVETMERQALYFTPEVLSTKFVQEVKKYLTVDLDLNDCGHEVVKLQNILVKNNYLAVGLNTGFFGNLTKKAVLKFQLEKGIVATVDNPGAGRVGPKTRAVLNEL